MSSKFSAVAVLAALVVMGIGDICVAGFRGPRAPTGLRVVMQTGDTVLVEWPATPASQVQWTLLGPSKGVVAVSPQETMLQNRATIAGIDPGLATVVAWDGAQTWTLDVLVE